MKLTVVEQGSLASTGLQVRLEKGGEIERAGLLSVLDGRGLRQLAPKPPSEETALRRAIDDTKPARHKKFSLKRGVWTIHLVYRAGPNKQEFPQHFSVRVDGGGRPRITWETSEVYGLQSAIEGAFAKWQVTHKPEDIGVWFRDLISRAMDAVPLGGDWWFIPKSKLIIFRQVEEALKSFAGYWIKQNDVTDSDNAAAMVLDGLREKAVAQLREIEDMLNEATEEDPAKMNERTIKARKARVEVLDKLKAQMKRYEDMFHRPLTDLELRVMDLKQKIAGTYFRNAAAEQGQATEAGQRILELDDKPVTEVAEEEPLIRPLELDDKPHLADEDEEESPVRKLEIDE